MYFGSAEISDEPEFLAGGTAYRSSAALGGKQAHERTNK